MGVNLFIYIRPSLVLFFSVLSQFKIVKPTCLPGGKNKQALKTKLPLMLAYVAWMSNIKKNLIYFIYQQKKYSTNLNKA
jgi:hypothetical protein